jgi:hypothetical protein
MKSFYNTYILLLISILLLFTESSAGSESAREASCVDRAVSSELVSASIAAQELLEIIQRIDDGKIVSARSLAESYLDTQVILIERLARVDAKAFQRNRGAEVISRVRTYRDARKQVGSEHKSVP